MHTVLETRSFGNAAKSLGLSDDERHEIWTAIAGNPLLGDIIKGTGGARKTRFGGRGKGKSSAYRVVTYYAAEDVPVFLLDIYAKGEKIDLSQSERNQLRKILSGIADEYRASVKVKVARLKEATS